MIELPIFPPVRTELSRATEDQIQESLKTPHGLFFYLKDHNPDHITKGGGRLNITGAVLYGFEHLGRDCHLSVLAEQLGLSTLQVIRTVVKINLILQGAFGLKVERVRDNQGEYTGQARITTTDDALQASQAYCNKLKRIHRDYVQTIRSYKNNGGDLRGLFAGVDNGDTLLELANELRPALAPVSSEQEVA